MHFANLHDWSDGAQVATAIAQILGFIFVIWQVIGLRRSLSSTAHSNIYARYADTIHYLLEKPDLYPYFRSQMCLKDSNPKPEIAAQVYSLCELTTALFEHATLERENMPRSSWQDCWLPYIRDSYEKSPEMRRYYEDKADEFYIHEYREVIANDVAPRMNPPWDHPKVKRQRP